MNGLIRRSTCFIFFLWMMHSILQKTLSCEIIIYLFFCKHEALCQKTKCTQCEALELILAFIPTPSFL